LRKLNGATGRVPDSGGMTRTNRLILAAACALLGGCAGLLPKGRTDNNGGFASYEAARLGLEQVQPYRSTVADLKALGFDVAGAANLRQVPYPQWMSLLVHPSEPLAGVDPGIRDCLSAQGACRAYVFEFQKVERERRGNFLADFLNFQRVTHTHGWRFSATVLVRDGMVLFRNHGGEANIQEEERRLNPLGPLQSVGESAIER
jgi:hypothetical protein